jgi:sterol desaturase/sphingolipid hydroxylase (fatty acid hydroxylase superfamily)
VDVLESLLYAAASFVVLGLIFTPLERAFPARRGQAFLRPAIWTDVAFFLGQYLLWNGLVLAVVAPVGVFVGRAIPGVREAVAAQPFALQALEVILLSDLLVYWGHRLQHRVGFLWRFHAVHHSAEHLDWVAAHREHPVDSVWTLTLINLPAVALGFPVGAVVAFVTFRGLWAIYIHSNVRLPLGFLRVVLGSPELHHWHHARDRHAGNYANLSPLMDVLFGTYRFHEHEPEAFGLREEYPRSYVGQLLRPFRPSRRRRHPMRRDLALTASLLLLLVAPGGVRAEEAPAPGGRAWDTTSGVPPWVDATAPSGDVVRGLLASQSNLILFRPTSFELEAGGR